MALNKMAALRIFLGPSFFKKPLISLSSTLGKNIKILEVIKSEVAVPVRNMGSHERRMNILPTTFEEKTGKTKLISISSRNNCTWTSNHSC